MSSVRKYPPKPMTGNTMTITDAEYGNGTYVASSNSVWENTKGVRAEPWRAFNPSPLGSAWHSENMINKSKTGYNHEKDWIQKDWIQLQLPQSIRLHKYIIRSRNTSGSGLHYKDFPNKFTMEGSNDGISWTVIDMRDDIAKTVSTEYEEKHFTMLPSDPYRYFRLVVENVGKNGIGRGVMKTDGTVAWKDSFASIAELSFFGEEYVEEEEEEKTNTKSPSTSSPSKNSKSTTWNPLGDGFFSMSNLGMWTYLVILALIIGLGAFFFMKSSSAAPKSEM